MEILNQQTQTAVIMFVRIGAKPQFTDKVRRVFLADAHGGRAEPGNRKMELYQANGDPNTFYMVEHWRDQAALDEHLWQPYVTDAFELQEDCLTEPANFDYLTELWPQAVQIDKPEHRRLTTLLIPFEVHPGMATEFIGHWQTFVPLVRAEPGNADFDFYRVNGSDTRFVLYERWQNQSDLDRHNTLPSTAKMVGDITPLISKPVNSFVLFATDIS